MATDTELLREFMDGLADDLRDRHAKLGQRASGETSDRIRSTARVSVGRLLGPAHLGALDDGRGPTRRGGGGGGRTLREQIFEWLKFKKYGITFASDEERESASWAIATVIHKEGNFLFRTNRKTRLLEDVLTRPRLDAFIGAFARNRATQVRSDLIKAYR